MPRLLGHKRDQIQQSQRMMFAWVAMMSVVVGFSLVFSWFLFQQLMFKTAVVSAKYATVDQLKKNNAAVETLKANIRVLDTSKILSAARAYDDDKSLQVILDALPVENNPLALSASVQQKLTKDDIKKDAQKNIDGLSITSLTIDDTNSSATAVGSSSNVVPFHIVVTADNVDALKKLLTNFQISIRTIDIDQLSLERSASTYTMKIDAHGYFEPGQTVVLEKKTIKLGGESKKK